MSRSLSVKCLLSQQQAVLFPSLTFSVLKCVSVCKTGALHTQADCGSALLCCTEGPAAPDFAGNEDNGTIRHLVRGENTHQQQAKVAFLTICFVTFLFALICLREGDGRLKWHVRRMDELMLECEMTIQALPVYP